MSIYLGADLYNVFQNTGQLTAAFELGRQDSLWYLQSMRDYCACFVLYLVVALSHGI